MDSKEKKLEKRLYKVAQHKMLKYIHIEDKTSINYWVIRQVAILEWELYQKYRTNSTSHYVSRAEYEADLERIVAFENWIIEGQQAQVEAEDTVKEAKELLELIAGYRVRDNKKPRVY